MTLETVVTPTITATVWIICHLVKLWIKDGDKKVIPTVAAVTGLALGLATIGLSLDGALSGMVSGLAATGANELFKQYMKDTTVTEEDK